MKPKIAPVKNIMALRNAFAAVDHPEAPEKIVLVYGEAGLGKTTAVGRLMCLTNAIVVRADQTWSVHSMLKSIMREMGEAPLRSKTDMADAIVDHMKSQGRPLIIDEIDAFTDPQSRCADGYAMLEVLRAIHDKARRPIVLVGMSGVEKYIAARKQLARRIQRDVRFLSADLEDTRIVADARCEVGIADDLLEKLHEQSRGNMGLIVVGMSDIENFGKTNRIKEVALEHWGERSFSFAVDAWRRNGRRGED